MHLSRLLLLCLSLVIAGCGFHLRGAVDWPPGYRFLALSANPPALSDELRRRLQDLGVAIRPSAEAQAEVRVRPLEDRRRILARDSQGLATEYELVLAVQLELLGTDGAELAPQQQIRVSRNFRYDASQALGMGREEQVLRSEMEAELAERALGRLAALMRRL